MVTAYLFLQGAAVVLSMFGCWVPALMVAAIGLLLAFAAAHRSFR